MTTKESILNRLTVAVGDTEKMLYNEQELAVFSNFYLDKWDECTSEDVVAESFVDFWWDTNKACRRCSVCGKLFWQGYCQNGGNNYYCSDKCLHYDYSETEWEDECHENKQSYYSKW